MKGELAKKLCPNFHTFYVQQNRGKADLTKYREASFKIFDIITKHCPNVEKASIDEAYLDLTDLVERRLATVDKLLADQFFDSYIAGSYALEQEAADGSNARERNLKAWLAPIASSGLNENVSSDLKLAIGALIVEEIRSDIHKTLGYHCSAGVAHNKTLAKLCCGINKPNKQTILPLSSHEELMGKTPIQKIKNLGGKLGVILTEEMHLKTMGDLAKLGLQDLSKQFGEKTGTWLYQISRGIDLEPVLSRQTAKSIGCSKRFLGKQMLNTLSKVTYWVKNLTEELEERLVSDKERNQRDASQLVINISNAAGSFSKTTHITKVCKVHFTEQAMEALKLFNKGNKPEVWYPGITILGLSASKFNDLNKEKSSKSSNSSNPLLKYFSNNDTKKIESGAISNEQDTLDKSNENKSIEMQIKSSSEALDSELERLNENPVFVDDSTEIRSSEQKATTSKQSELCSKEDKDQADESSHDAENFNFNENSNDIVEIDQVSDNENSKKSVSPFKFPDNFFNTNSIPSEEASNNNREEEDVDYVKCEKCRKQILVWEFPEHEDFHFAQELSKQICMPNPNLNPGNDNVLKTSKEVNNKKRPMTETPTKTDEGKATGLKAKKMKQSDSKKSNTTSTKPINSFFKKS